MKTIVGKLIIEEGNPVEINEALFEARRVFNEVLIKLLNGVKVREKEVRSFLLRNTKQRVIAKAKETFKSFNELRKRGQAEKLRIHENKPLPLKMNFREGYNLWSGEDGGIRFRISLAPGKHVKGRLLFSREHEEIVKEALEKELYKITMAELVKRGGEYYLHIVVTKETHLPAVRYAAGIDINEDNVAVTVYDLETKKAVDTFIVDYSIIKFLRHYWFTIRKRIQKHGGKRKKLAFTSRERRQIKHPLHIISKRIAYHLSRYPGIIVFMEELTDIRNGSNKGKRMNRRLHSWSFYKLQQFLKYKLEWMGAPVEFVPPKETSHRCPLCGVSGTRHKKMFKCPNGHIGHADRNASVNILIRGCVVHLHVPRSAFRAMKLPNFRMWRLRRDESGAWGIVNMPLPAGVEPYTAAQRQEAAKLAPAGGSPKLQLGVVHALMIKTASGTSVRGGSGLLASKGNPYLYV